MSSPNRTLKERAYLEFKEFLVISLYLWVVFGLFLLYKSVILNDEHINVVAKGFALINALALAKIMLIARALHFGEWADGAPLIYPTLLKSHFLVLSWLFSRFWKRWRWEGITTGLFNKVSILVAVP